MEQRARAEARRLQALLILSWWPPRPKKRQAKQNAVLAVTVRLLMEPRSRSPVSRSRAQMGLVPLAALASFTLREGRGTGSKRTLGKVAVFLGGILTGVVLARRAA